jgi:hypothetical protein
VRKYYTISDAIQRWNALTGADERETLHHVRVMRESGFLSASSTRTSHVNVARFVICMLAGAKHADAPIAAMGLADAPLSATSFMDVAATDEGGTFLSWLTVAIGDSRAIQGDIIEDIEVGVDGSHAVVRLVEAVGGGSLEFTREPNIEDPPPPPVGVYPVQTTRKLSGKVITALAMLTDDRIILTQSERDERRRQFSERLVKLYGSGGDPSE